MDKVLISYEINKPTTVSGHSVTIKYTYCGTEEEINNIIEYCRENIGALTVCEANTSIMQRIKICGNDPSWCESCVSKGKCEATRGDINGECNAN